ncbi:MAG: winged helix-turn-helix domain-containing protein [Candidatus Peribacteria bacterium]|nr:winged helix-turn-helix domain-containing protein [Candidatus Peribacteria bacterium]
MKEVKRKDRKIILTPKEFIILEYLMKNKDKVIPKQELLEYIW